MKKKEKGFTLVEVLIAMTVFAVMSLLVCTLYAFLNRMVYMSNDMNNDVDSQAAKYESGDDSTVVNDDTKKITFNVNGTNVEVNVDYKTIDGNDTDTNPNIKYFEYKP